MNRTRTSIALATAAMCATVLVSNAGAEPTRRTPISYAGLCLKKKKKKKLP
nr:hypothetical protein [Corynebacterium bouchesdurhonense]